MLSVKDVSKFYGQRFAALSDISFEIEKGEMIFLTGASGAGKTTLLKLLYHEERPTAGDIKLGPFHVNRLTKKEIPLLRRHIGVVFQDFRLIPERTAAENVALALEVIGRPGREIKRRTDDILKLVGVWEKRSNYPHQLSGGEAQRVALARAMVNEPLLILADEPTGNLDEGNGRELFRLFGEVNLRGATILVATHQVRMAKEHGKRTLHLLNGTLPDQNR